MATTAIPRITKQTSFTVVDGMHDSLTFTYDTTYGHTNVQVGCDNYRIPVPDLKPIGDAVLAAVAAVRENTQFTVQRIGSVSVSRNNANVHVTHGAGSRDWTPEFAEAVGNTFLEASTVFLAEHEGRELREAEAEVRRQQGQVAMYEKHFEQLEQQHARNVEQNQRNLDKVKRDLATAEARVAASKGEATGEKTEAATGGGDATDDKAASDAATGD